MILIVAHTPSPNLTRLADALHAGAVEGADDPAQISRKAPLETSADDVRAARGLALLTPENLGYMAGAMKDFFDRVYYPVLEEKQGLPFVVMIRAGHDGTGTSRAITTITTGLRWKLVQPIAVAKGAWDDAFVDDAHVLGQTLAAGIDAGVY